MSKLKRTVTPARRAANRRAALKSTGPRTLRGKQRSSLNALGLGRHSRTVELLWKILANAPPFGVLQVARQLMTPAQLAHPDVAYLLNLCLAEGDEPIEPDPDPSPGGFLYDLDEMRKTRGVGKGQSKPKSPLESAAAKNEPTNSLIARYLSNLSDQAEENKPLRHIFSPGAGDGSMKSSGRVVQASCLRCAQRRARKPAPQGLPFCQNRTTTR